MFSLAMIYAFSPWDSNTTATKFMKGRRMSRTFGALAATNPRILGLPAVFDPGTSVNLP
jgi:hypothetical protein